MYTYIYTYIYIYKYIYIYIYIGQMVGRTVDGRRADGEWWMDSGQTADGGQDCARRFPFAIDAI